MKLKHNKKRNTAFLYEALVKELTKAIVNKDIKKKNALVSMLKENFSVGRILQKELELIKTLSETKKVDMFTAERLLTESASRYSKLDADKIFEAQSKLIESINKNFGKEVYGNFVPNYKHLATVHTEYVCQRKGAFREGFGFLYDCERQRTCQSKTNASRR